MVTLPLIFLSILPLCGKHLLKGGIHIAVMASRQSAILHLLSVCDVGNCICKVYFHVSYSCLMDTGDFCNCDNICYCYLQHNINWFFALQLQLLYTTIMYIVFYYCFRKCTCFKLNICIKQNIKAHITKVNI